MTLDVVIVGDGPAGRALGAACIDHGSNTLVIGEDRAWTATYGTWLDEVTTPWLDFADLVDVPGPIDIVGTSRLTLRREYGVFDNGALRSRLAVGDHLNGRVESVTHHDGGARVRLAGGEAVEARLVVDATGPLPNLLRRRRTRVPVPIQAAYGLVLDHRPDRIGGNGSVLMDWTPPSDRFASEATFLYVVRLPAGRWLVEETSLARHPAMGADELRMRLADRLGADLTRRAEHVETVSIAMAPGVPDRGQPMVGFGAAAGYIHPATGYSVAASLRAAPRVAAWIAAWSRQGDDLGRTTVDVWNAVWPSEHRRARALHDYGLAAILRMSPEDVGRFFQAFFELPVDQWSAYLRVDTSPRAVAAAMTAVFRTLPAGLRLTLARGNPLGLARLVR